MNRSVGEPSEDRTDWEAVDALTDAEIDAAIRADPDAAPPLTAARERNRR